MSSRSSTLKGRTSVGSESVRSSSPTQSRAVDELRRQLLKVKGDLEAEKQKARQAQRNHTAALKDKKDELERKHKLQVESVASRKEQEKVNELKLLEDRLNRQKEIEFRKLQREKNDEMKDLKLKLSKEHDIKLRSAVDAERQKLSDQYGGEDPSSAREAKLAREVFMRSEENEQIRDQMRLLKEENKDLLDQIRRLNVKHESEMSSMLKQSKLEAARESARLQLAERRLMETEQEVIDVEQRVGYAEMKRENLMEEIEKLKGLLENQQHRHAQEMAASPSVHIHNQLQRRVNELESLNQKLEQQMSEQRQEIATLRKKTPATVSSPMKHPGGVVASSMEDLSNVDRKALEKKLHDYRRRNKELLSLAKQLDGRQKALQIENDSLMESKSRDSTEAEKMLRKQFVKQQIKEREEHTKELRAKDKQIDRLKKELETNSSLVEEATKVKAESDEMLAVESNMKVMSRERLQLELQLAKLLKSTPENGDIVAGVHTSDMISSKRRLEQLEDENGRVRKELSRLTEELSLYKGADLEVENSSLKTQVGSLKQQLEQQAKDADEEITHLTAQINALTEEKKIAEGRTLHLQAEVNTMKETSSKADKNVAMLNVVKQHMKELEEECTSLKKKLAEEQDGHKESQQECHKLHKDLSKAKELQELIKIRDEEKKQLEKELDQSRRREEEALTNMEKIKQIGQQELAVKERRELERKQLEDEVEKLKVQLRTESKMVKKLEETLGEANTTSRKLGIEISEKDQEISKLKSSVKAAVSTRPVSTQCNLPGREGGKSTNPPLAARMVKTPVELSAESRSKSSPTSGIVQPTSGRRNTVATVPDHSKDFSESKQMRSVSIPNSVERMTPTGRQGIRSARSRPKSGGRRSAGNIHWPVNRGIVPPYIAASQGDNLQSELREAGADIDDVFDSEAVKITESEMDLDAFGDDLLETTQSNVSLEGLENLPPLDRNQSSPVKSVVEVPSTSQTHKSSVVSSSESPESPGEVRSAKYVHQIHSMGDEDDDIIGVSNPSLPRLEECSEELQEEFERPLSHDQSAGTPSSSEHSVFSPITAPAGPLSLYKALYSYDPVEQSPNPNPETELSLQEGQMLVVRGDVREDGFLYGSVGEAKGLVPSNFVEKIRDLSEEEVLQGTVSVSSFSRAPVWGLKDIAEEEEFISPPSNIKLERQFVDQNTPNTFKAIISWTPPTPLPANMSGYRVYVNNVSKATVATETKVLLSDLPVDSACSVVVCTLAGDRESEPTSNPIIIGAKFPLAPVNLSISPTPGSKSLLLRWKDNSSSTPTAVPATLYTVSIDNAQVAQIEPTSTGDPRMECVLSREMLTHVKQNLGGEHTVTVRSHHFKLESQESEGLIIDPSLLKRVFVDSVRRDEAPLSSQGPVESEGTTVVAQVEVHNPSQVEEPLPPGHTSHKPKPTNEDTTQQRFSILDLVGSESESTSEMENGPSQKKDDGVTTEGVVLRKSRISRDERNRKGIATLLDLAGDDDEDDDDDDDGDEDDDEELQEDDGQVMFPEPKFYKAHTEYNPRFMSDNVGMEDDELEFKAGDVIKVIGMESPDWLIGQLRGQQGVVPITFVKVIEDPELIQEYRKEFDSLLPLPQEVWVDNSLPPQQDQQVPQQVNGGINIRGLTSKRMIAIYGYNPEEDSPNDPEDRKDELTFSENDIIIIYGGVDEFGFYKGELNGRIGLVPSNFLKSHEDPKPQGVGTLMVIPSDEEDSIASDSVDSEIDFVQSYTASKIHQGVSVSQGR